MREGAGHSVVNTTTFYYSACTDLGFDASMSMRGIYFVMLIFHGLLQEGIAEATIVNITIDDISSYSCDCDVEDPTAPKQGRDKFDVKVYSLPSVYVKVLETEIDLIPKNGNNLTAQNSTGTNETKVTVFPSDGKMNITRCTVNGAYPKPSKIVFHSSNSDSWTVAEEEYFDVANNDDGTVNVSANLNIKPTSDLDGVTFTCTAHVVDDEGLTVNSEASNPLAVKHLTSYTTITVTPQTVNVDEQVTISCNSNGNPVPRKTLHFPTGRTIDVSKQPYKFPAQQNSAGSYYCTAGETNQFASSQKYLTVNWMYDPSITGESVVEEGTEVRLECKADSSYPISYKWLKNGDFFRSSRIILFDGVKASDSGLYECVAEGFRTLSVKHQLQVEVGCNATIRKDVSYSPSVAGQAYVELTCTAKGNPGCEMQLTPYKNYVAETKPNLAKLVIDAFPKQVQPMKFTCTASNEISKSSTFILLDHNNTCCAQPSAGGLSTGVVVLLIILGAFAVIGIPLVYFVFRRKSSPSSSKNEKRPRGDESEKLNDPVVEA